MNRFSEKPDRFQIVSGQLSSPLAGHYDPAAAPGESTSVARVPILEPLQSRKEQY
jgi:hypothetical protein